MKRLVLFLLMLSFMVMLTGCSNKYQYSRQLIEAIEEDNWERFEDLLAHGGDIDSRPYFWGVDRFNYPPLHYACYVGKIEYVVALVEAGADVNNTNNFYKCTPLMMALQYNSDEIRINLTKYLVESGADAALVTSGNNALAYVIRWNGKYNERVEREDFDMALYLIGKGAKIEFASLGNLIFDAAMKNNLLILKYLILEKGVDINLIDERYGNTALMWAVQNNCLHVTEYLIEQGANLDIVNKDGKTVFDMAFQNEYSEEPNATINKKIRDLLNENR